MVLSSVRVPLPPIDALAASVLARRRLVGVLRAATGAGAHADEAVLGADVQDARRDGQHVEEPHARERGVDGLRRGVLEDLQPAPPALARGHELGALEEVDGDGVVGQVCVIDAVAAHVLAPRPLAPEPGDLRKARGELVAGGHQHGDPLTVGKGQLGALPGRPSQRLGGKDAHARPVLTHVDLARAGRAGAQDGGDRGVLRQHDEPRPVVSERRQRDDVRQR